MGECVCVCVCVGSCVLFCGCETRTLNTIYCNVCAVQVGVRATGQHRPPDM